MDVKRLRAEPGGQAQLSVKVKNPGHLVESFRMDVVGLDPTWWQVHPPELAVYPGKEESAASRDSSRYRPNRCSVTLLLPVAAPSSGRSRRTAPERNSRCSGWS